MDPSQIPPHAGVLSLKANDRVSLDVRSISELFVGYRSDTATKVEGETQHRINLINAWGGIPPGSRILELGCGQGDCTAVLATAVGEHGHVTAVDPGPSTYGTPYTLGQAQAHLSGTKIGSRIRWVEADSVSFLRETDEAYDIAVLAHSLYYFSSPSALKETFALLKKHVKKVFVAEWALSASSPEAIPHLLAVLAQTALESRKKTSFANVRIALSPARVREFAKEVGLHLASESIVVPSSQNVYHGRWEVNMVLGSKKFNDTLNEYVKEEREREAIQAIVDALAESTRNLPEGVKPGNMDVWVATFE